jgi:hypothetical protein
MTLRLAVLLLGAIAAAPAVSAAELRPETTAAFDRYVRVTEAQMESELLGTTPFLWIDQLPNAQREEAYRHLQRGEFVVSRLTTLDDGHAIDVPQGLIHHWMGAILIPGVSLDRVIGLMQGYDRYQDVYGPNVRRARIVSQRDGQFRVFLQLFMKKVISVVLNTDNDVRYTRLTPSRAHVRSYSTRINEVQNPGAAGEAELPAGRDSGFLWRFNNYCSLEERGEGTYVQCESLSLSRGIPPGLGWVVGPFVTSIPRESLEFTLGHMRAALVNAR